MSLSKAMNFLKTFTKDEKIRSECYSHSLIDLETKYGFAQTELEDAINMQLVKCQTEDEASRYLHLKTYLQLILADSMR